jgi:SAM-dependent methyltransferase
LGLTWVGRAFILTRVSTAGGIADECWLCSSKTRAFWSNDAFTSVECRGCGHIQAEHRIDPEVAVADYHRTYDDQQRFVASLGATRRRQAARLLDELSSLGPIGSLFDFGCGRGWFLEVAQERGLRNLAGGDVSDLALDLVRQRGLQEVRLERSAPLDGLRLEELGFIPEAVTFLDVIEHFPGDLTPMFSRWLARLPAGVRFLVIKVPIREGLLFSMANLTRRVGFEGLGRQFFQAGTYPPHYQYFSRRSLSGLIAKLGLREVRVLDDLDFEPEDLANRLGPRMAPLKAIALPAGRGLAAAARVLGRQDSRIIIAERGADPVVAGEK